MLNLLIFGPPGAGKGTQAALLSKKYHLNHLSSGDLLRQERGSKIFGEKIKKYQDAGKLVPDSLIIKMIEKTIIDGWDGPGFVFDGYPRNIKQARALDNLFKKHSRQLQLVLNLKLGAKEATERILQRGKSSGRSDDNRKTITNRLQIYKQQTAPLLEYYRQQGKLKNIDGRPDIETVFSQMEQAINESII